MRSIRSKKEWSCRTWVSSENKLSTDQRRCRNCLMYRLIQVWRGRRVELMHWMQDMLICKRWTDNIKEIGSWKQKARRRFTLEVNRIRKEPKIVILFQILRGHCNHSSVRKTSLSWRNKVIFNLEPKGQFLQETWRILWTPRIAH